MKRITRRQLVAVAAVPAVALAQATPPVPAQAASDSQEALAEATRENNRRAAETLAKFELPVATEPAFHFKA